MKKLILVLVIGVTFMVGAVSAHENIGDKYLLLTKPNYDKYSIFIESNSDKYGLLGHSN
jgi:hypothetical protein